MKRRRLLLVFLLCSTCFALQATPNFTAIYQPEQYLEFKNGTDPYTNSQFVALLGTMTVEITSPVSMRQPSFVQMNSSAEFYFRGMFDWNPNNINTTHTMQNTQFYLDTVTTVRNPQEHVYKIRQSRGDGIALLTTVDNWYNVSFFETKIYLRAIQIPTGCSICFRFSMCDPSILQMPSTRIEHESQLQKLPCRMQNPMKHMMYISVLTAKSLPGSSDSPLTGIHPNMDFPTRFSSKMNRSIPMNRKAGWALPCKAPTRHISMPGSLRNRKPRMPRLEPTVIPSGSASLRSIQFEASPYNKTPHPVREEESLCLCRLSELN